MNFLSFDDPPPQEESATATYPFDTQCYVDDLPDCANYPPSFTMKMYVTGARKVRETREKPLPKRLKINGCNILLWRLGQEIFATSPICPHQASNLDLGDMEDFRAEGMGVCITCPAHSWKFDVMSGNCQNHADPERRLTTYPVTVDASGRIYVLFQSFDQSLFSSQESEEDF